MPSRVFSVWLALAAAVVNAQPQVTSVRVASGFSRPVVVTAPLGDLDRIFVVEQYTGQIRIVKNGTVLPVPFLDINPLVIGSGSERGLLGLTFHLNYLQNGYFFLNYNDNSGTTVVARYRVSATNPDVADPTSAQIILTQAQPFSNHNAGALAFSPVDGYLYVGFGDGGSGNDPGNRAQTPSTWLGKMLRIDVDNGLPYTIPASNPFVGNTAYLPEIWAVGLRNPWRYSFDRVTGDLWIGDVGQNAVEEVDFQPASSVGGENYGWRCMEGLNCTGLSGCTCNAASLTNPVQTYSHALGCSITGGYVYRGCAIPGLQGTYFYADYCSNRIWSFALQNGVVTQFVERTAQLAPGAGLSISAPASFGEDGHGEMYICDLSGGEIFKIVPVASGGATLALAGPPTIGTTVDVNLSSPSDANRPFACAFAAGVEPGIVLSDLRRIPLNQDAIFFLSIDPANPFFLNTVGTLDASGLASVQMVIPFLPALQGVSLFSAFAIPDVTASSGVGSISCALPIVIQ